MNHGRVTRVQGIHTSISYIYADAAGRSGASGFVADDVGKIAYQTDTSTYWFLESTTPTWAQISVNAATPLWRTLLNVDFTLRTTQVVSGDGAFVVPEGADTGGGEVEFVVENFSQLYAGAELSIVNGSGMRFGCQASGTSYSARTAPLIRWPLPAAVTNGVPVRVCAQSGLSVSWSGELYLGIDYPSASSKNLQYIRGTVASGASVFGGYGHGKMVNNSGTELVSNTSVDANTDLIALVASHGISSVRHPEAMVGKYSDGAFANMSKLGCVFIAATPYDHRELVVSTVGQAQNWGVALSGRFGSLGVSYQIHCRRLRVEAFY